MSTGDDASPKHDRGTDAYEAGVDSSREVRR